MRTQRGPEQHLADMLDRVAELSTDIANACDNADRVYLARRLVRLTEEVRDVIERGA